ncbi:hypothetical protein PG993_007881 [Apiospora rasikravindrae]|uniref:Uncharacterized protein n=1 Tax=Apiospora rasikravindrae TaxID=990691 RepID=A0ABR1T0I1_9PEZI
MCDSVILEPAEDQFRGLSSMCKLAGDAVVTDHDLPKPAIPQERVPYPYFSPTVRRIERYMGTSSPLSLPEQQQYLGSSNRQHRQHHHRRNNNNMEERPSPPRYAQVVKAEPQPQAQEPRALLRLGLRKKPAAREGI